MSWRNRKKILKRRLSQLEVKDMMENKLRAQTIPSKKVYKRKKKMRTFYDD